MSHQRGRFSGKVAAGLSLSLIITPMLDMSFQLLAFFIMTYHPSALEGHIPGLLAPPSNPANENPNDPAAVPGDPAKIPEDMLDPRLNDAVHVKITAIANGEQVGNRLAGLPKQLFIRQSTDVQHQMLADVNVDFHIALKRLDGKLKELIANGAAKKTDLKIEGDGDLHQQYIIQAYDTCKKAGFDNIHFVPPPMLNSKLK